MRRVLGEARDPRPYEDWGGSELPSAVVGRGQEGMDGDSR